MSVANNKNTIYKQNQNQNQRATVVEQNKNSLLTIQKNGMN